MRQATNISSEQLLSLGTCVGKFTKGKKFYLRITFLDHMAQYAKVYIHINNLARMLMYFVVVQGLGQT